MTKILLMLKTHQPKRLNEFSFFDLGKNKHYFNDGLNKLVIDRVADRSYLPTNKLLKKLIKKSDGKFKISLSISGTTIDQLEKYRPDALESFVDLVKTGSVEILSETYHHSLSYFYSKEEFVDQVKLHRNKVAEIFDVLPVTFVNTEFTYNDELAYDIHNLGFWGILTEGVDWALGQKGPDRLYLSNDLDINVFFRNHGLSNDIGYRFSDTSWKHFPLDHKTYYRWLMRTGGEIKNLFMDYETFGEHHLKETGIFRFFNKLIQKILRSRKLKFERFQDVVAKSSELDRISISQTISWADQEKDLSAWRGNAMQFEALMKLYELEEKVKNAEDPQLLNIWRNLQVSDHFYYMSTKGMTDGQVHSYFSPYNSPHDAYRYYMNVLSDFEILLDRSNQKEKVR